MVDVRDAGCGILRRMLELVQCVIGSLTRETCSLRHSARHTMPRKLRPRDFRTPKPIVSGLADWCRDVVFKPFWMETRDERGGLSDLLTLPPSQSPS